MRMMFACIHDCGKQLKKYLKRPAKYGETLEMKEIMSKYTTDVIGTCAFGLKLNSMKNPNSEFRLMGRKLFEPPSLATKLKGWSMLFFPSIAKYFNTTLSLAETRDFFLKAVRETVEFRESNKVERDDFINLLIQLKNNGKIDSDGNDPHSIEDVVDSNHEEFTENMLAAQAFVFFVAGFETSSTTMSFCLHELAVNPEIQCKLQEELDVVRKAHNGIMTYEAIQGLVYLDKVVAETLRKYPPIPNLSRVCTKPYTIPGTSVLLDQGTRIVIPIHALHHDPNYFPEPDRFNPERFSEEQKISRHRCAYMPFGDGPRMCIGNRFGLMQTKVGLAMILSDYTVSVSERTTVPLTLDPNGAVTTAKGGSWLCVNNRTTDSVL